MEPGQDPDDLVFVLDECHDLLEQMGQTVHDESYEYTILHPLENQRVRTSTYDSRRDVWLAQKDIISTKPSSPVFAITLPCWGRFRVVLLIASLWVLSQTIHRWLSCWSELAKSLAGTHWKEELQDHRKTGTIPGEELTNGVPQEVVLKPQEQAVSPTRASLENCWLDRSRFNTGDIRV